LRDLARGIGVLVVLGGLLVLFLSFSSVQAQTESFQPLDRFDDPANHSSIRFLYGGSYANASLQDGFWFFQDLRLGQTMHLDTLRISIQDCNITITSLNYSTTSFTRLRIRFMVEGQGSQTVNFGVVPSGGDWVVALNSTFPNRGEGWSAGDDGTVTVTGARSGNNVSIAYYGYYDPTANLPFIERHSVAIWTVGVVAAVVVVVTVIWWLNRNQLSTENNQLHRHSPVMAVEDGRR
jgi:hypothetical protein